IEGSGTVRGGDHAIADNVSAADGDYAAHTRGANTGAIGVACCCMVGCNESPFRPGRQPLKKSQWEVMVQVVAELCQFYSIPVTSTTVLGHGEVQKNLGIMQRGKWDPMVWPWNPKKSREEVGASFRAEVTAALGKPKHRGRKKTLPIVPVVAVPADPPADDSYTLRSDLLAGDPTLQKIAATDLVLIPPQHSMRVDGIADIQEALNRLAAAGHPVPQISFGADNKYRGFYGPTTTRALRAFQRSVGIGIDGRVGDDTLRALDEALLATGSSAPIKAIPVEILPVVAKPEPVVILPSLEIPPDLGAPVEDFARPAATSRTSDGRGGSTTTGLHGEVYQPQPNLQVIMAEENLTAKRDGKSLGTSRAVQQLRVLNLLGKSTSVEQPDYCWSGRKLPGAALFLDHPGFAPDAEVIKGEASYFGKFDTTDEGTGTPVFGLVQTNSSVFGVSLPESLLVRFGLARKDGKFLRKTDKSDTALVEIYFPRLKRMVRAASVDVGPHPRLKRPAELSVAAAAFLQDEPEEKAKGYKLDNMQVQLRIV
ncbi:MAG: N-acetylmuramoyl-L-alanine amidase, partial [Chthoniobacterales bacterium]